MSDGPDLKDTYRSVTRGWWWRGFFWGFCIGWGLGSLVTYILFWITGSLA